MRNWTSRQSEVMYETDRVVILFFTSKDEGKRYAHHTDLLERRAIVYSMHMGKLVHLLAIQTT